MNHGLRFTAEKIAKRLALIRPHVLRDALTIPEFTLEMLPTAACKPGSGKMCGVVPWDSYWAGQDTHFALRSTFEVPADFAAPALHLPLGVAGDIFTHPEALLHIDGKPVASADRHHQLVPLDASLAGSGRHDLLLHGWTGLTGWPPERDNPTRLQIARCAVVNRDARLQEFVALAEVALDVATLPEGDQRLRERLLQALDDAFLALDTRAPIGDPLHASVAAAHETLAEGIRSSGAPAPETLHAIGHAHMDIAYLWPIAQIRQKNARTYSNVLNLMDRYEDFHFSHSQPQLYAYTETDHPEIFSRITERVAQGRWEAMGGMWVEPDCNIPGGEALVRQIVLGRRYFAERFGDVETPVLWLPDTFGFPWSLPQLMKQAGLKYFVTNKLNWNQYNRMPSSTTWWQGIDGSRVLAHCLTTPRQVQHLPFPTNYKSDLSAAEVIGTVTNATGPDLRELPIAFGYGDGGGGPNDDLVRKARAYAEMPGAPALRMSTVREYFAAIEPSTGALPIWNGELYLEGHRGTFTSQAWIKRANRKSEVLLHETEAALALADPAGAPESTRRELRSLWEKLCLNQFHDILTGTSIGAVFEEARRDFDEISRRAEALLDAALKTLASGEGWSVFNAAPVPSASVVFVPEPGHGQDVDGGSLASITPVPAYALASLNSVEAADGVRARQAADGVHVENAHAALHVTNAGQLRRVIHKASGREVFSGESGGNQLWASEDRPISWDAWDIDIFHDDRPERLPDAEKIELVESGPLRATIRVETRFRQSRILQWIRLHADSARVDFDTEIDWHERHTLLKAAFATDILSPNATYEIQWGEIERPTHRNTTCDVARFEVPAQRWADLSETGFGVAVLNDCKYGHGAKDGTLTLTLVKSSTSPNPDADQGLHRFTYAVLPHAGDRTAVRAEARRLNIPARIVAGQASAPVPEVTCDSDTVMVETVKPADDGEGFILRLFESDRRRSRVTLQFKPGNVSVAICDLMERNEKNIGVEDGRISVCLKPFEIVTLRVLVK